MKRWLEWNVQNTRWSISSGGVKHTVANLHFSFTFIFLHIAIVNLELTLLFLFTSLVSAIISKCALFLRRTSSTSVSFVFIFIVVELHPDYAEFRPRPVNKPFWLIWSYSIPKLRPHQVTLISWQIFTPGYMKKKSHFSMNANISIQLLNTIWVVLMYQPI